MNDQFNTMQFQGVPQSLYGTGMQFNGMQPNQVPQIKNNLSQEEIQKLMKKENEFSLGLTEIEKLRAGCNHRWNEPRNGQFDAIVEGPDGICRCSICGYEFDPVDMTTTEDSLKEVVKNVLDVLQTIKLLYLDMPANTAKEYYQIIPLIERIPKLFEMAARSYAKYDSTGMYGFNNKNMNTMQLYNMLNSALTGAQPMPQQQMYNPYQQQQMGYAPNPMGYQGPMMGSNGFVAQPAYMPNTMGYQYDPNMQQPAQAPAAAPAASTTTDGKNVTVDATFKA